MLFLKNTAARNNLNKELIICSDVHKKPTHKALPPLKKRTDTIILLSFSAAAARRGQRCIFNE